MPESQGQFEHAALEKEIKELTKEIEQSGNLEQGKEAIKEAIGERIYKSPLPPETEQASQAQPQTSKEKAKDTSSLPSYAGKLPAEAKLRAEQILDLAWHKGINDAKLLGLVLLGYNCFFINCFRILYTLNANKLYAYVNN